MVFVYCCMIPECAKTFDSQFSLKQHIKIVHLNATHFSCDICEKDFPSKKNWVGHSYLHTGVKPFVCRICNVRFRQASQLSLHKRRQTALGRLAAANH